MTKNGVTVKCLEDFEANHDFFFRVRSGLGITAFGLAVEKFPANCDWPPEHDEADSGQEEVYVVVDGTLFIRSEGDDHKLTALSFASVSPGTKRKLYTRDDPATVVCIGGVPGKPYVAPKFTDEGASWTDEG